MNLLSTYDRFSQAYPADGALASFRQEGFDYALNKGLPTRKDEEWHYTSVKVLGDVNFMPSAFNPMEPGHETLQAIKKHLNPLFTNLVFFNGVLNRTLSEELPAGFTLRELSEYPTHFDDTFDALAGNDQVNGGDHWLTPLVFRFALVHHHLPMCSRSAPS